MKLCTLVPYSYIHVSVSDLSVAGVSLYALKMLSSLGLTPTLLVSRLGAASAKMVTSLGASLFLDGG
jgi:hypothetical protein